MRLRAVFFEEDDARAVAARLAHDGFEAVVERERLAGEDDDEDHPWAVLSDAPELVIDVLVEQYDGWLDDDSPAPEPPRGPAPGSPRHAATGQGPLLVNRSPRYAGNLSLPTAIFPWARTTSLHTQVVGR